MRFTSQDLLLSTSLAVYMATSLIFAAVRWGHKCEPFARHADYYYPAWKALVLPVQYPDGTRHLDAPGGRCRPASADAPPPGIALFSTVLVFLPETQIQGFSPTTRFGSNWKVDHRYILIDDNVSNELRGRDIILFVADRDEISAARYRTNWTSLARCAGRISYY